MNDEDANPPTHETHPLEGQFVRLRGRRVPAITRRQADVLAFVRAHLAEHGHAPTHHEIAAAFGLASPRTAARHLLALKARGFVSITPNVARGVSVFEELAAMADRRVRHDATRATALPPLRCARPPTRRRGDRSRALAATMSAPTSATPPVLIGAANTEFLDIDHPPTTRDRNR